jgi:Ribose/xylose/arabinose/galactoside ABC-type transport systems, permease components
VSKPISPRALLRRFQKPIILLVVMAALTILQPDAFATESNFKSILLAISLYGVMVTGAIFAILLGGIDLSVGAVAALSGACVVLTTIQFGYSTVGVIIGIVLGLAAGCAVGLFHGVLVTKFQVPAFLITLATMNIIYGVAQLLTGNQTINCTQPELFAFIGGGRLFGVPFPIYVLAIMAAASFVVLNLTVFGRKVYAVGGNPVAARLSGISVGRTTCLSYMISGFTAALAGIVLASMNQQAISKAAQGYENDVLTAIVVGGTSLMGGEGTIQGAIFGALLVGLLNNGLRLMGVSSIYHPLVKGIIIVIAVAIDLNSRNRGSGLQRAGWIKRRLRPRPSASLEGAAK